MIIHTQEYDVKKVGLAAFPDYRGRKFTVQVVTHPIDVRSYWDGGSKDYFNFVRLDNLKAMGEVPQQSMFDKQIANADKVELVSGLVCVRHSICCGKDCGLTIMVHPDNAPQRIESNVDLTDDERLVLKMTSSYKSSYAGIKDYRFYEGNRKTGITIDKWNIAKASLTEKKLLNRAGAITNEGRNAIA